MNNKHALPRAGNSDLRQKIDQAKLRLPMPSLMGRLGYGEKHIGKEALCPFHDDENPSFSVFQKTDGTWWHRCFVGCPEGDEIAFLAKARRLSKREAITRYLEMAGFRPVAHASREYPKSHEYRQFLEFRGSLNSPEYPVSPVSNGQGREEALKAIAAHNACTERNTARKRRWKLVRDLRALEKGNSRELNIGELMPVFDEWYRLSQPFLDPAKTRDAYLAAFLAELRKVRVPTGEGDTLRKALEAVSKLSPSSLPVIPGMPDAPEGWRRLAALHRELSRLCANGTYFLSCRDAARAHHSLSYQLAADINLALARLGVIKIIRKGQARLNGGKAAEFRYLLRETADEVEQSKNGTSQAEIDSW